MNISYNLVFIEKCEREGI